MSKSAMLPSHQIDLENFLDNYFSKKKTDNSIVLGPYDFWQVILGLLEFAAEPPGNEDIIGLPQKAFIYDMQTGRLHYRSEFVKPDKTSSTFTSNDKAAMELISTTKPANKSNTIIKRNFRKLVGAMLNRMLAKFVQSKFCRDITELERVLATNLNLGETHAEEVAALIAHFSQTGEQLSDARLLKLRQSFKEIVQTCHNVAIQVLAARELLDTIIKEMEVFAPDEEIKDTILHNSLCVFKSNREDINRIDIRAPEFVFPYTKEKVEYLWRSTLTTANRLIQSQQNTSPLLARLRDSVLFLVERFFLKAFGKHLNWTEYGLKAAVSAEINVYQSMLKHRTGLDLNSPLSKLTPPSAAPLDDNPKSATG